MDKVMKAEIEKILKGMVKKCHYCHKIKQAKEFHKDRTVKDGLSNCCIPCRKAYNSRPEVRERNNLRKRIAFKKDRKRYYQLLEIAKTPKGRARGKLRDAVDSGKIIKPKNCPVCGKDKILHGHHNDYTKPLEVVWVCALCHTNLHKAKVATN
jgi:hypothetical protein